MAKIESLRPVIAGEPYALADETKNLFSVRIGLADIWEFEAPISLRPIVDELCFIRNKTYWGHSLRFTPRKIGESDMRKILAAA
jgi:predicted RNA-binding protein